MAGYELRSFSLPAELEDQLTAELWALGALGFEIAEGPHGRQRLDAYFPAPTPDAFTRYDFTPWRRRGVTELTCEELADRDWLAPYRAACEPFDVGSGFRVDPGDPEETSHSEASGPRHLLRIPARTAFGTGSHPSTGLALEWLEALDLGELTVLDVGTGSGILSFAALVLGAEKVVGFDLDAQATCLARANAALNGLKPRFFAGRLRALRQQPGFDLALVNILPEHVQSEIPRLTRLLKPGARVISSGNLTSRRDELLARWSNRGFELVGEKQQEEWTAWLLTTTTPP